MPVVQVLIIAALAGFLLLRKKKSSPKTAEGCYAAIAELGIKHLDIVIPAAQGALSEGDFEKLASGPAAQGLQECLMSKLPLPEEDENVSLRLQRLREALTACKPLVVAAVREAVEVHGYGERLEALLRDAGASAEADCLRKTRLGSA